jgi:glycosyltransferase involved in cell wall biosynthesis
MKTLTVGITAFNEQANIKNLIKSVLRQKEISFKLKKVLVVSDGSTDKTELIVKKITDHNSKVFLIADRQRKGKTCRLNELYKLNNSNFLLTLDADILLSSDMEIEKMIKYFSNKKTQVVAANLVPVQPEGFWANVIYTIYKIWDEIRVSINDGDHIANLYGAATMLRKNFSKKVRYPTITCDEEYLYILAKQVNGFRFAKDTQILYIPVSKLSEYRIHTARVYKERNSLISYFGPNILKLHQVPFSYKFKAILKYFVKSPVFTILALGLTVFLRMFPEFDTLNEHGLWQITTSTKKAIA